MCGFGGCFPRADSFRHSPVLPPETSTRSRRSSTRMADSESPDPTEKGRPRGDTGRWDVVKARQLYDQGESLAEIAIAVNVSRAEIASHERKWWRQPPFGIIA